MRDTLVAYNEIEPYAVEYMRWLMNGGLIAPGYIFTDPLEDLTPNDLRSFKQIHWCAGVGVWSHALRQAGWADDRPIWTASLPCQPFSAAGKGDGFADQRHLWPFFLHHVITLRPQRIVGEQVESPDGMLWFDAVCLDLEGAEYASRAVPICSAGFGSPDIRNRNYWLADDTGGRRRQERADVGGRGPGDGTPRRAAGFEQRGLSSGLADTHHAQRGPGAAGGDEPDGQDAGRSQGAGDVEGCSGAGERLGDPGGSRLEGCDPGAVGNEQPAVERAGETGGPADAGLSEPPGRNGAASNDDRRRVTGCEQGGEPAPCGPLGGLADAHGREPGYSRPLQSGGEYGQQPQDGGACVERYADGPGPVNGFWRDADWILCRDPGGPRWRPVEPGTFPLVAGSAQRMGRLRSYGNAINAQVARAFIEELMADDLQT